MFDHQSIDPFTGVNEDLAAAFETPYERIFQRQQTRDPLAIPSQTQAAGTAPDLRANLLSGLAAVVVTVALFLVGIAAVVAPNPAFAEPARVILL